MSLRLSPSSVAPLGLSTGCKLSSAIPGLGSGTLLFLRSRSRAPLIALTRSPVYPAPPGGLPTIAGPWGHLQPAAEFLHRAPTGGHGVAQQEHQDAPLGHQPPQHRLLFLALGGEVCRRDHRGVFSMSTGAGAPHSAPHRRQNQNQGIFCLPSCKGKKERKKKKNFSLALGTYLVWNQPLQLCLF